MIAVAPTLKAAIAEVDRNTQVGPAYYMINCAHPSHFAHVLEPGAEWSLRVRGLRSNASRKSHQERTSAATSTLATPSNSVLHIAR